MKNILYTIFIFISFSATAQKTSVSTLNAPTRPRLVVGMVVDQMRWDYLYRYYDIYKANGGFKRLLQQGFSCENTMIPYTPTVTAAGHTCIYTGSVPALHGIIGNDWYDAENHTYVYCTDDSTVSVIGSENKAAGAMSPRNMWASTITDELRLATNGRSKVVGIAIKDRGAILPAGHGANGAYWYDSKSGNFITSSYYKMTSLPEWATKFNERKIVDSLYALNWNLSMPANTYPKYCGNDDAVYERRFGYETSTAFPHILRDYIGKDYGKIAYTPWGNTLTLEMSKAAIEGERLGLHGETDFLAVSLSSPDYAGHSYGPNSWELLDMYARLDMQLADFFNFLDATIGKGNYLFFLSADHGVAHVPGYLKDQNMPAGLFNDDDVMKKINAALFNTTGVASIVETMTNYQLYYNHEKIDSADLDIEDINTTAIHTLLQENSVQMAFPLDELMETTLPSRLKEMIANGYNQQRSGDIQFVLKPGYIDGYAIGTTHGLWNPFDAHIPLVWYGWQIKPGKTNASVSMADISPTLAALLHIQMPNSCIGKVIEMK